MEKITFKIYTYSCTNILYIWTVLFVITFLQSIIPVSLEVKSNMVATLPNIYKGSKMVNVHVPNVKESDNRILNCL